jgi:hypothetical protein
MGGSCQYAKAPSWGDCEVAADRVGDQATGLAQIDAEMAALLELRTPMGTAAQAAIRVRMEAWRQWR